MVQLTFRLISKAETHQIVLILPVRFAPLETATVNTVTSESIIKGTSKKSQDFSSRRPNIKDFQIQLTVLAHLWQKTQNFAVFQRDYTFFLPK